MFMWKNMKNYTSNGRYYTRNCVIYTVEQIFNITVLHSAHSAQYCEDNNNLFANCPILFFINNQSRILRNFVQNI